MKLVIGSALGILTLLAIVIWLSTLSDPQIEITEKETIHLCQELALDLMLLTIEGTKLSSLEELEVYAKEFGEKNNKIKQLVIQYDCTNTTSEWYTAEFIGKMEFARDYGFLP